MCRTTDRRKQREHPATWSSAVPRAIRAEFTSLPSASLVFLSCEPQGYKRPGKTHRLPDGDSLSRCEILDEETGHSAEKLVLLISFLRNIKTQHPLSARAN